MTFTTDPPTSEEVFQTVKNEVDLPTPNPPELGFVTSENAYYVSKPIIGFFDVTNFNNRVSINAQQQTPVDIAFSNDGLTLFELAVDNAEIYQYDLQSPFELQGFSFNKQTDAQSGSPESFAFNDTGDKIFIADANTNEVREFDLSTPFDIGNMTFVQIISINVGFLAGIEWNNDGTRLFALDGSALNVIQYNLTNPYDISTASAGATSLNFTIGGPRGLDFSNDGTRMHIVSDGGGDSVQQYNLATPFDVSTATFDFTRTAKTNQPTGISWNDDGSKIFICEQNLTETIFSHETLTGGWEKITTS